MGLNLLKLRLSRSEIVTAIQSGGRCSEMRNVTSGRWKHLLLDADCSIKLDSNFYSISDICKMTPIFRELKNNLCFFIFRSHSALSKHNNQPNSPHDVHEQ